VDVIGNLGDGHGDKGPFEGLQNGESASVLGGPGGGEVVVRRNGLQSVAGEEEQRDLPALYNGGFGGEHEVSVVEIREGGLGENFRLIENMCRLGIQNL
jgi:hypothetical protein